MFVYCGNNPAKRQDSTGHSWRDFWEFIETAVSEAAEAIKTLSPAYAGCGGAAAADGPLPIGDIIGLAVSTVLTIGAVGYGVYKAATSSPISKAEEKEKAEVAAIDEKSDRYVIFPVNPYSFKPTGLEMIHRDGTKNGSFISWMDPLTNTEVFRWDENPNYPNGPHYHILGEGHYIPGIDIVPEPFSSIYFPFG